MAIADAPGKAARVRVRRSLPSDLAYITALERRPDNRELIGQWSDGEHLAAIAGRDRWSHWIVERGGRPAGYLICRDCRVLDAGLYIKRILVGDKERGIGQAALGEFLAMMEGIDPVWLIVRNGNERAQALYRKLGFVRFEPEKEEGERFSAIAEAPEDRCFRMILRRT